MHWLLLLFVGVPLIEIALFVEIGGQIGLLATVAIVIGTAILGSFMLRQQGLSTIGSINASVNRGEIPVAGMRDGALLIAAAALLLTPGFLTDAIGFALFFPPVREFIGQFVFNRIAAKVEVHTYTAGGHRQEPPTDAAGPVIDGEAVEIDGNDKPPKSRQ